MFLLVKCASVTDSAEEHKQTELVLTSKVLFKLLRTVFLVFLSPLRCNVAFSDFMNKKLL